ALPIFREDNGLIVPKEPEPEPEESFNFVEAVIPAHSELIGTRIRDSDFRKKFKASIIAIHRNGKRLPGKVGEMSLAGGDFLLLLSGDGKVNGQQEKDLFYVSIPRRSEEHTSELQSRENLVCRLLLEKKKKTTAKLCT